MKILPFSPDFGLEWAKSIDFLPFSPDWPIFHKPLEPSLWFVVCGDGQTRLTGRTRQTGPMERGGGDGVEWGVVERKSLAFREGERGL